MLGANSVALAALAHLVREREHGGGRVLFGGQGGLELVTEFDDATLEVLARLEV